VVHLSLIPVILSKKHKTAREAAPQLKTQNQKLKTINLFPSAVRLIVAILLCDR